MEENNKKIVRLGEIECPEFLDYNEHFETKRKGFFFRFCFKFKGNLKRGEEKN